MANHGHASVRRIYGDWTSPSMKAWRKEDLLKHSINAVQQFAYVSGKNATDIALVIGAMDLLYTGRFSTFCIVRSDSDFTPLASRLREQGVTVLGIGDRRTAQKALVAACSEFKYFDALPLSNDNAREAGGESDMPMRPSMLGDTLSTPNAILSIRGQLPWRPATTQSASSSVSQTNATQQGPETRSGISNIDSALLDGIRQALLSCKHYEDDWVNLAHIGIVLKNISPDFTPRNYKFWNLTALLEASGIVDIKMKDLANGKADIALARLKSS